MTTDRALNEFLNEFDNKKRRQQQRAAIDEQSIAKKRASLEPIRRLLSKFTEFGIIVSDADRGARGVPADATKQFSYYEGESSPSWYPGVSLFFDHPVPAEIAIPNEHDQAKEGVVVIRLANNHKDQNMLLQRFANLEVAAEVLAKFLGKNALGMAHDPRSSRPRPKRVDASVLSSAPAEAPASATGKGSASE